MQNGFANSGASMADPESIGCDNGHDGELQRSSAGKIHTSASASGDCRKLETGWWEFEPAVGRVAYGIPNRVERLRAYGNAIVPAVAKAFIEAFMECRP